MNRKKDTNIGAKIVLIVLFPILLLLALFTIAEKLYICFRVLIEWVRKEKYIFVVYSDSPNWKEYVEKSILSDIEKKSIILNWSDKSKWNKQDLAVKVFNIWLGEKEFNPAIIVFKPWWKPQVIRLWEAFNEYKHGKKELLHQQENLLKNLLKDK
jgi:hypothetical protein